MYVPPTYRKANQSISEEKSGKRVYAALAQDPVGRHPVPKKDPTPKKFPLAASLTITTLV
jgi:hypothetical protein